MPKQINTYQVGQALVRKFGLKGRFQPVLDEVIVPVVTVGETEPTDVRLGVAGASVAAAGAGNQNLFTFRNPPNTNVLVTLKSWWATSGAPLTDFVTIAVATVSAPGGSLGRWRDRRLAGNPQGTFTTVTSPTAVLSGPFYHLDNDDTQWFGDWILPPGHILNFRQNAVNTTLIISWYWEETDITASLGV